MKNGPTGRKAGSCLAGKRLSEEEGVSLAVKFLAARDRTMREVQGFLEKRGASASCVKFVISQLLHLGYLNDRVYAERWLTNRLARRPMGRERLRVELMEKGIDQATIEELMGGLPDEVTVARSALDLLGRKRHTLTPLQIIRRLRQRGFDEETISQVLTRDDEMGSEAGGGTVRWKKRMVSEEAQA